MSNRRKLTLIAVGAWIAGVSTFVLLSFLIAERPSLTDIAGITVLSVIAVGVNTSLVYVPGLYWLRRRRGSCEPAIVFAGAAGLVLNIPAIVLAVLQSGATMGTTEALLFAAMMIVAGSVFGFAFARVYEHQPVSG
ncbi:MAG TPA: hypothetical protein VFV34_17595 [Blastocatellia bacterium]|nr:hypothetical protein [Blastocatellia bacterium]